MKRNKKILFGVFLAVVMLLAVSVASAITYTVNCSENAVAIKRDASSYKPEYQPSSTGGDGSLIVVDSFDSPGSAPYGLAWNGNYLWNADRGTDKIYKIDPSDGSVIKSFNSPDCHPSGLAWGGDHLWNADSCNTNKIYKLYVGTFILWIIDTFDSPGSAPTGLAWDGSYLWHADHDTNKIYKIDPSCGNVVDSFDSPENVPTGLAWDGSYLWNADWGTEKIYKIDPSDGNVVASFDSPESGVPTGLAWDGSYLWNADYIKEKIYKLAIDYSPEACYTWEDADGDGFGTVIDFDASCSTDDNGIVSYEWDWTSDGTYDETGEIISHDYGDTDQHDCTLRVTDTIGQTDTETKTVQASGDIPPIACYNWEDADGDGPGTVIDFDASCSTDDNGITSYEWDWTSDGTYDETGKIKSHDYDDTDQHDCTLRVTDTVDQTNTITETVWADVEGGGNRPPVAPNRPNGPTNGEPGESYTYSTSTIDPDDDNVYYWFDWGDGSNSGWIGPYASGETSSKSHTWSEKGEYNVKAKAKDTHDEESSWSPSLEVTIDKHILLTEGFEYGVMPPPSGWYTDNGNPRDPWKIISKDDFPSAVHSGDYAAIIYSNYSISSNNWLISPELDLTDCSGVDLEFWAYATTFFDGGTIKLHIMGDGFDDIIWDMIKDEDWPLPPEYRKVTFNLDGYIGKTIRIGWQLVGKNGPNFGLDDITITNPKNRGCNQQQNQQQQQPKIYSFQETNVGMSTVSTQKMSTRQLEGVNK